MPYAAELRIDWVPTFAVGVPERALGWGSVRRVLCRCSSSVVLFWHVGHGVYVFESVCMFVSGGSSSLLYPDGRGPKTDQTTQSPVCSHKPKDPLNTLFIGKVSGPAPFFFLWFGTFCSVIGKNSTIWWWYSDLFAKRNWPASEMCIQCGGAACVWFSDSMEYSYVIQSVCQYRSSEGKK